MSAEIDRLAALLAAANPTEETLRCGFNCECCGFGDDDCSPGSRETFPIDERREELRDAAVNALPHLLAVARAAEALPRNALHVGACSSVLTVELNALRAALAALFEHARVPTRD